MTKSEQLHKNKAQTDLSDQEKNKYFSWIKENKTCVICGEFPEIHHITNKSIKGSRRKHERVLPICFFHHSAQSPHVSIHNNPYRFYKEIMSLKNLLFLSDLMYLEFKKKGLK